MKIHLSRRVCLYPGWPWGRRLPGIMRGSGNCLVRRAVPSPPLFVRKFCFLFGGFFCSWRPWRGYPPQQTNSVITMMMMMMMVMMMTTMMMTMMMTMESSGVSSCGGGSLWLSWAAPGQSRHGGLFDFHDFHDFHDDLVLSRWTFSLSWFSWWLSGWVWWWLG